MKIFQQLPQYDYEIIIADNYSTDGSRNILRRIAAQDKKFKVIFNSKKLRTGTLSLQCIASSLWKCRSGYVFGFAKSAGIDSWYDQAMGSWLSGCDGSQT